MKPKILSLKQDISYKDLSVQEKIVLDLKSDQVEKYIGDYEFDIRICQEKVAKLTVQTIELLHKLSIAQKAKLLSTQKTFTIGPIFITVPNKTNSKSPSIAPYIIQLESLGERLGKYENASRKLATRILLFKKALEQIKKEPKQTLKNIYSDTIISHELPFTVQNVLDDRERQEEIIVKLLEDKYMETSSADYSIFSLEDELQRSYMLTTAKMLNSIYQEPRKILDDLYAMYEREALVPSI